MLHLNSDQTVAMIAGTSFAAGLNVYATVGVLGLMSRAGVIELPSGLHLVTSWWIIGVCLAMFALEFFADKVPMFDLLWNALTYIRAHSSRSLCSLCRNVAPVTADAVGFDADGSGHRLRRPRRQDRLARGGYTLA